jgi:transposase-like protein
VRTIFAQPSAEEAHAQLGRVIEQLEGCFPDVARLLEEAAPDITAFAGFPIEHWRQIWSNNPQERLNREIRRRSDMVGIFPDRASIIRLVDAVLAERHDERQVARLNMSQESLTKAMEPSAIVAEPEEEEMPLLMAS